MHIVAWDSVDGPLLLSVTHSVDVPLLLNVTHSLFFPIAISADHSTILRGIFVGSKQIDSFIVPFVAANLVF